MFDIRDFFKGRGEDEGPQPVIIDGTGDTRDVIGGDLYDGAVARASARSLGREVIRLKKEMSDLRARHADQVRESDREAGRLDAQKHLETRRADRLLRLIDEIIAVTRSGYSHKCSKPQIPAKLKPK